jgi:hypothetical protein
MLQVLALQEQRVGEFELVQVPQQLELQVLEWLLEQQALESRRALRRQR